MTDLSTEMLSVAEDLLTLAAPKQVEKMRDALIDAYNDGYRQGFLIGLRGARAPRNRPLSSGGLR